MLRMYNKVITHPNTRRSHPVAAPEAHKYVARTRAPLIVAHLHPATSQATCTLRSTMILMRGTESALCLRFV